jgi:hypothetical protein
VNAEQIAARVNAQLVEGAQTLVEFEPVSVAALRGEFLDHHEHVLRFAPATVRRYAATTNVEFGLLRMIKQMTAPFEVRDKGLRLWEIAILEGYAVWRQMVANGGGVFVGDANARTISNQPLPKVGHAARDAR